jgi:hypothetical protein
MYDISICFGREGEEEREEWKFIIRVETMYGECSVGGEKCEGCISGDYWSSK